jgi:hypothetical protein
MAANGFARNGWLSALTALASSTEIDFILVGGAAMALHGLPRQTMDIDIYLPATTSCLRAVFHTLERACGLVCRQEGIKDMLGNAALLEGQWITFCEPEGPDLVDVFVESPSLYLELKMESSQVQIGDVSARIASLAALRSMKLDCGRPIDLSDAALISEFIAAADNTQQGA